MLMSRRLRRKSAARKKGLRVLCKYSRTCPEFPPEHCKHKKQHVQVSELLEEKEISTKGMKYFSLKFEADVNKV